MAEKKKMSTAEILAAARKGTAGASEPAGPSAAPPQAATPQPPTPPANGEEAATESSAAPPAAKPKPAASGAKPSVAEILAKARAEKAGGAAKSAEAPAAKPVAKPAAKAPTEKPAAKPRPEKVAVAAAAAGPAMRDTSSILAAARAAAKPGPVSKAEAAARLKPSAPAKPAKGETVVPPMPAKPEYAKTKVTKAAPEEENRRFFMGVLIGSFLGVGFTTLTLTTGLWTLASLRFMFPNVLTEPPSKFKIGFPSDFPPGVVDEKFKAQFGIWPVSVEYKGLRQIVALKTVCTHLGCTPNWLEAEQKFKCPCHGSGFYKDGINFEGPAPRPLERYAISRADDGQLEVDKSRTFQEELGQWSDPACFVTV